MNITGSNLVPYPVELVWEAILDPRVLVATIPGCERLVETGENAYDMTVTAGVAAIKGTYQGSCTLSDLERHESLVMTLTGAGAPGTIDATVRVYFGEADAGIAKIDYEAEAVVGGMVGGVGQRMLTSVSKRMAAEFFGNVASAIEQGPDPSGPDLHVVGAPAPQPAGVHGACEEGRRLVAGRLPQGHRRRRRTGRARRDRRIGVRQAPMRISVDSTARDQADAVRRREISARELLDLHLARIAERNPELNAIVSLDEERARGRRRRRPTRRSRRAPRSGRCTGCPSPSRTPTTSPGGARRTARRSSPTTSPRPTS